MLKEALRVLSFNLLKFDDPYMNKVKIKQEYKNKQDYFLAWILNVVDWYSALHFQVNLLESL